MGHLLGMPELASQHGGQLDQMMGWIHLMMLVLFVGWMAFFSFAVFRFRRSRQPVADYAGVKSHASTYHEIIVVILEAVFLLGFSIPIWAQRVRALPPEHESVVVRVTAEQFAWNVRYPGPDGVFGKTDVHLIDVGSNPLGLDRNDPAALDDVVTLNQLHLPVNKPAIIQLTSKDVIHCFALQEMRIKQDIIPGMMTPAWFVPTVTTEQMRAIKGSPTYNYEIGCAQLCGLGHYRMRGFLTIDNDEASFQAWLASQGSS
jgi:cytochrome c oxidase subunit 2